MTIVKKCKVCGNSVREYQFMCTECTSNITPLLHERIWKTYHFPLCSDKNSHYPWESHPWVVARREATKNRKRTHKSVLGVFDLGEELLRRHNKFLKKAQKLSKGAPCGAVYDELVRCFLAECEVVEEVEK